MGFLADMSKVFAFLKGILDDAWDLICDYPYVLAIVVLPFVVWLLMRIVGLVQNASRFDVAGWDNYGLVGIVKRYKERREDRQKEAFAHRIFQRDENLDIQWVDIDGQRFYRPHRSRRYKVRFGDRSEDYYNPRTETPVYDGKRSKRNLDELYHR